MTDKINISLKILQEVSQKAQEAGTPLLVNFSGGKDSSSVLLLAKKVSDAVEAIYMASGFELPGTIEFVQKEADRLKVPLHITDPIRDYMGDLAFWVRKFGYFPSFGYTFCSSRLKIRPSRRYLRKIFGYKTMYRLNGVRKAESSRRNKMYRDIPYIRPDGDLSGSYIVYPILDWDSEDVANFLKENNFEVHKQYSSFGVSGCSYCPYYQKEIYYRILSVYPNIYDDLIALENEMGKPSVTGNVFMKDLKNTFLKNRDEILANLPEIKNKKNYRKA